MVLASTLIIFMMKLCLLVAVLSATAGGVSKSVPENLQKKIENLNGLMSDNLVNAEDDPMLQKKISDLNDALLEMQKKIEAAKEDKARKMKEKAEQQQAELDMQKKKEEDEQKAKVTAQQQQAAIDVQKRKDEDERKAKAKAQQQQAEEDMQKKKEEDERKAKAKAQQQQAELDVQRKKEEKARKEALKTQEENEQKAKVKAQQQAEAIKSTASAKEQQEESTASKQSTDEQEQYRRDVELLVKLMVPVTAWDIWLYTKVFPYLPISFRSPSSSGLNAFLLLVLLCICMWIVKESRRHAFSLENEIKAMEFQKKVTQSPDTSLQDQLKVSKTVIQNMKQERLALDIKILALASEKDSLTGLYNNRAAHSTLLAKHTETRWQSYISLKYHIVIIDHLTYL